MVGATDRPGSYGDNVLRNLAAAGFEGAVWGVNPKREEVHGRPCVPSVADLPEPVDAVVVAIPAAGVPAVAARSGRARLRRRHRPLRRASARSRRARALERELREAALGGGAAGLRAQRQRDHLGRARAPLWGDSVDAARARRRSR